MRFRFLRRITGINTMFAGFTLAPPEPDTESEPRQEMRRRFSETVEALASGVEAREASAIVTLESFLADEYRLLHEELHGIVCVNLSVTHAPGVARQLVRLFEKSLRAQLAQAEAEGQHLELVFPRCWLHRVNLSGLNLSEADFAFADLSEANLERAVLREAKGFDANIEKARLRRANLEKIRFHQARAAGALFHEARLVDAKLRDAILIGAEFARAELQGAHFDRADLTGATFQEALLADAYFPAATFDDVSLKSLARNSSWRRAHFDDDVCRRLQALSP